MLVHVAALVELGLTTELFYFAHTMVKELPTRALSWYCVGAYYFSAHKYDYARRFMQKATMMDQHLLPAWIGFAHAYAVHDESDRSMAAYRNAARLFPGSHEPVLGTAMEYLRTNNVALAELFCRQALSLCDSDPAVYNELGVVYYRQRNFTAAVECFQQAMASCAGLPDRMIHWEGIGMNLAHALRRAGQLEGAVVAYGNALARVPKSASGHGALGLTFHLLGDYARAVERYHLSLGIKPEDALVNELLAMALVDLYGG
jgi:anaphase-promoting complex subunit 6